MVFKLRIKTISEMVKQKRPSIPRVLTLREFPEGVRLVQNPIAELKQCRQQHYHWENIEGAKFNKSLSEQNITTATMEIEAEFEFSLASEFGIKVRRGMAEETLIGYDALTEQLFVDRTRSGNVGFADTFPGQHLAPLSAKQGNLKLHILIDECSVEVFGNGGQIVISDLIFPSPQSQGIELFTSGGDVRVKTLDIWTLA